jgi:hypothetical protein
LRSDLDWPLIIRPLSDSDWVSLSVPSSYLFERGEIVIVPRMLELPRIGTIALLLIATATLLVTATRYVSRLRDQLSKVERLQAVQAWHFSRLGAELMASGDRR